MIQSRETFIIASLTQNFKELSDEWCELLLAEWWCTFVSDLDPKISICGQWVQYYLIIF